MARPAHRLHQLASRVWHCLRHRFSSPSQAFRSVQPKLTYDYNLRRDPEPETRSEVRPNV